MRTKAIAETQDGHSPQRRINSEEQRQYLYKWEHVGSDACIKHRPQNQNARFFKYMVDQAVWGFKC